MSVNFKTSKLKDNEYATYNLNNFNGVDYTDSPTNVDDSRAIDISNYLPDGNSLYKRKGWEKLEYYFTNSYSIANIFRLKDKYIFLARSKVTPTSCQFYCADDLDFTNGYLLSTYGFNDITATFTIAEDYNGWAVEKDGRLFVLTGQTYVMIYYDSITIQIGQPVHYDTFSQYWVQEVSEGAYVPTIAIGVQDNESYAQTSYSYEELNMLSNEAYIEFWLDFSNSTFTSTTDGYNWIKKGYFDLEKLFPNISNLAIEQIGSTLATNAAVAQTGYYGVGLLQDNGEQSDKFVLLKLNGKKLNYEAFGINSTHITYVYDENNECHNISDVTFDKKVYSTNTETYQGSRMLKIKFLFTNTDALNTINKMRFGILYGANNYKDTLFATGNPDYPNMDIHTCTPKEQGLEDWVTYTYFGDMSYHKIGSSSSAIIGYGISSDSSLIIFKQSITNEPNVYIRTATYKVETKTIELSNNVASISYENAYILYQVYPSAINIKCDTREQVVQFDNKVFINGKYGIYYVNVNSSTAESSYDGIEASFFIRNDLGNDISNSCIIEYNEKLYVLRTSKNGKKRIYVCDKNRYSYHNSKLIYEWWVLDDVPAERLYVFDGQLYFTKSGSLYRFTDNYYDLDKYKFNGINISVGNNSESFVTDLFFDYAKNEMIITGTNEFIVACKNSPTPKEDYQEFRDKTTVKLGTKIYWVLDDLLDLEQEGFIMKQSVASNEVINTIIHFLEENNYKYYLNGTEYQADNNWEYEYNNETLIGIKFNTTPTATEESVNVSETAQMMIPIATDTQFNLTNLNDGVYDSEIDGTHDIEKCVYKNGKWIYIDDGIYTELPNGTVFNHFTLTYNGLPINYALDSNYISSANITTKKAVKSYWLSNYNHLGKLDYLKTATNIYFVPDARRGGYTYVGYRTYKKDVGFYSNSKGEDFSFNDINFDDFSFSQTSFGRTYSSKKKIKNFSFIQMKFYSYDEDDSTLVACTFRYKYSKNNKGVK